MTETQTTATEIETLRTAVRETRKAHIEGRGTWVAWRNADEALSSAMGKIVSEENAANGYSAEVW